LRKIISLVSALSVPLLNRPIRAPRWLQQRVCESVATTLSLALFPLSFSLFSYSLSLSLFVSLSLTLSLFLSQDQSGEVATTSFDPFNSKELPQLFPTSLPPYFHSLLPLCISLFLSFHKRKAIPTKSIKKAGP
jgi:hypothetical protein